LCQISIEAGKEREAGCRHYYWKLTSDSVCLEVTWRQDPTLKKVATYSTSWADSHMV